MPHYKEREQAVKEFKEALELTLREEAVCKEKEQDESEKKRDKLEELLWELLMLYQGYSFSTMKGLEFSYTIKGYEMFVSRKEKSITRSTIMLSFRKAVFLRKTNGNISGPKKLGTFGASYLYPVFIYLGIVPSK